MVSRTGLEPAEALALNQISVPFPLATWTLKLIPFTITNFLAEHDRICSQRDIINNLL